jgi:diketogulonate reductase-like aldo/keto reductase
VCQRSVEKAFETGYRHIDTAEAYGNHRQVGEAVKSSGIPRDELFITSKIWMSNLREDQVIDSIKRALDEIDTEYINLMLIHWPNRDIPLSETLGAMQRAKEEGLINSIGVSNFNTAHLEDALDTDITVENNQVEFHPTLNQKELEEFCLHNGTVLTAYSPLAQGEDLKLDVIQNIAEKYKTSTSQVILNWLISKKIIAIPRSSKPEHIEDNFRAVEWNMEDSDIDAIDNLNTNNRLLNPSFADFEYTG